VTAVEVMASPIDGHADTVLLTRRPDQPRDRTCAARSASRNQPISEVEQRGEGFPDLLQQEGSDVAEAAHVVHDAVEGDRSDVLALCS
jgi:hypothetical protein